MCGRSPSLPLSAAGVSRHMPREGRIVQVEPPVAAEHRDALGERFERFALHADQRLVAAHQLEPLGHVVEQIGDAAFRVGRGDDAQRAAVGQVPFVLRAARARGRPRAARSSSRGSRPAREACARRAGGRARRSRSARNRGTPARGPTARDRRRCRTRAAGRRAKIATAVGELVERAAVRLGHARELGAHRLDFGHVDADAGAAARRRPVDHVEDAPRAGDDHRQARLVELAGGARACRVVARRADRAVRDCARPRRRRRAPRRRAHRRR